MSSGSWMMPRPSSQDQTRLTMLRANQGFFGADQPIGEDLPRILVRGSWAGVPSGKTAASARTGSAGVALPGSKKTISSFHSAVDL